MAVCHSVVNVVWSLVVRMVAQGVGAEAFSWFANQTLILFLLYEARSVYEAVVIDLPAPP